MATRITVRRDRRENFVAAGVVPASGEPIYETDTKLLRVGDGRTPAADLDAAAFVDSATNLLGPNVMAAIRASLVGSILDLPGGSVPGAPGTRRAQYEVSGGGEGTWANTLSDTFQRVPLILPVQTTRWRLRIANMDPTNNKQAGAIAFNGVWVGAATLDAIGSPTGAFQSVPTAAIGAFTSPADGSSTVTGWVTSPSAQIAPNTITLLSMGWTKANSTTIVNGSGSMFYNSGASGAGSQNAGTIVAQNIAFGIMLEYEFVGSKRSGLAVGDSLTEGKGAGFGFQTWHQVLSRRTKTPIAATGAFGRSAYQFQSPTIEAWQRIINAGLTLDFAVVQLGTNDIAAGTDLPTMQASIGNIVGILRTQLGIREVYFNNIAPRGDFSSAQETQRQSYNTWLQGQPFGIAGVFDVSSRLESAVGAASLRADSDLGDHVHWTTTGNWRAAQAVNPQR